jgi:branched-chain amino acid transport system substrate-binding protein
MGLRVLKHMMGICALGFGIGLSASAAAEPTPVKVGILVSQTGPMADIGQMGMQSYKLAEKELKSKFDNERFKVTFIYSDSRSTPESAATAVNKLIKSDGVDVIIGDLTSTVTLAAAPIAQAPSSTSDKVTQVGNYISRACYVDSFQGIAMANYAYQSLNARTAVLLVDTDMDHSRDVSKIFEEVFQKRGGRILSTVTFSGSRDTSTISQLTQIRKLNPDVIYAPVYYSQMGPIFKQAKALGIKSKFLGTDAWDSPQLFKLANGATAGMLYTSPFSYQNPSPEVQKFRAEYKKEYKTEPSSYAALAYDAMHMLDGALERVKWPVAQGQLPEKINEALTATANVQGVTGRITLDAHRNVEKPDVVILKLTANGYDYFDTYRSTK